MSAAKIPSIRERMRRQEILTRELGGPTVDRLTIAPAPAGVKQISNRGPQHVSKHGKPIQRHASKRPDYRRDRVPRRGLPGFASLIRKVIAY
jgi:hypothetical protein